MGVWWRRVSKKSVNYSPSNGKDSCGECVYFVRSLQKCDRVNGTIRANYWCELFKRKK